MGSIASSSSSSKVAICYFLFIFVGLVSSFENAMCPFDYLFHMGDEAFDTGNAIRTLPEGPSLPAAFPPYGQTVPGYPTGRFSDGLLDIDYGGMALGFPELRAYLDKNDNASDINAIIFGVDKSPVLDRSFFESMGVELPSYVATLDVQISWFKEHLYSICSTPQDCADILGNSFFLFGDVNANDVTVALLQGKSIEEIRTYVHCVTEAQIYYAREVISMGASRIVFPGNSPMGCYPFILTEFASDDPEDYDDLGCLKNINDLIQFKNNDLNNSVNALMEEFPDVTIFYSNFYDATITILQDSLSGPNQNVTLKACCGIGGEYNYDKDMFCGSEGVPVCDDPSQYVFWDGINLTNDGNDKLSTILQQGALELLNCTTSETSQFSQPRKLSQLPN